MKISDIIIDAFILPFIFSKIYLIGSFVYIKQMAFIFKRGGCFATSSFAPLGLPLCCPFRAKGVGGVVVLFTQPVGLGYVILAFQAVEDDRLRSVSFRSGR